MQYQYFWGCPIESVFQASKFQSQGTDNTMEVLPVLSLRTLIGDWAMVISNTVQLPNHEESITIVTHLMKLQSKAFKLLVVRLN